MADEPPIEILENQDDENTKQEEMLQYYTLVSENEQLNVNQSSKNLLYVTYETNERDFENTNVDTFSDSETVGSTTVNIEDTAQELQYNSDEKLMNVSNLEPIILPDGSTAYLATNAPENIRSSSIKDEAVYFQNLIDVEPETTGNDSLEIDCTGSRDALFNEEEYQQIKLSNGTYAIVELKVLRAILDSNTNTSTSTSFDSAYDDLSLPEPPRKKNKVYQCPYEGCRKLYTTTHHLKVHERSHTGAKPFNCDHPGCDKAFATTYSLKTHFRTHTGEKPYQCQICSKPFNTSGDLQKHTRVHTGERPFPCFYEGCNQAFTTSNIRKVHLRTHTGERPYKCDVLECGKTFASATNYKNHMRIHSGEKPFACKEKGCSKRFTEYSSLYKHQIVHKGLKQKVCSFCGRFYRQMSTLNQHIKSVHRNEITDSQEESTSAEIASSTGVLEISDDVCKPNSPRILYTNSGRREMLITDLDGKHIQINSREQLTQIIKALSSEIIQTSDDDRSSFCQDLPDTSRKIHIDTEIGQ